MRRADMGLSGHRSPRGIYCGLVSGYTAKLAAFVGKKRLDKGSVCGGHCWRLCESGSGNGYRGIRPEVWPYT